jgi:hypothetical protein
MDEIIWNQPDIPTKLIQVIHAIKISKLNDHIFHKKKLNDHICELDLFKSNRYP